LPGDLKPTGGHNFQDMAQDLLLMNSIAQARRKQRFEKGSLVFLNREFQFNLNPESSYPLMYQESPSMPSK
jgi:exoribonuclease R